MVDQLSVDLMISLLGVKGSIIGVAAEAETQWVCDSINVGRNFNQPNLILLCVNRSNMDPFNWSTKLLYIFIFLHRL